MIDEPSRTQAPHLWCASRKITVAGCAPNAAGAEGCERSPTHGGSPRRADVHRATTPTKVAAVMYCGHHCGLRVTLGSVAVITCREASSDSHETEGFETRRKVILSFGEPCHLHMGDSCVRFYLMVRSQNTKYQLALTFVRLCTPRRGSVPPCRVTRSAV